MPASTASASQPNYNSAATKNLATLVDNEKINVQLIAHALKLGADPNTRLDNHESVAERLVNVACNSGDRNALEALKVVASSPHFNPNATSGLMGDHNLIGATLVHAAGAMGDPTKRPEALEALNAVVSDPKADFNAAVVKKPAPQNAIQYASELQRELKNVPTTEIPQFAGTVVRAKINQERASVSAAAVGGTPTLPTSVPGVGGDRQQRTH
jgi:hypothetical protein